MSTFIIRIVGRPPDILRGTVKHVSTGEEAVFSSAQELLRFIEGMVSMIHPGRDEQEILDSTRPGREKEPEL